MKHDPTTEQGKKEIKKIVEELKAEKRHYKKLAQEDVENEPVGPLTDPSEIHVKRILKRNEDR